MVSTFYSLYVYVLETNKVQYSQSENQGWEASNAQSICSGPLLAHNRLGSLPFKEWVLCWPFPGPASWSNSAPTHSQPGAARAAGRVTCSSCSSKSSFGFWSGSCYRHARYVCYQWIKRLMKVTLLVLLGNRLTKSCYVYDKLLRIEFYSFMLFSWFKILAQYF